MKIIGESSDSVVMTATKREVANLIGYFYEGESGCRDRIKVGSEIEVANMYRHLYELAIERRELEKLASKLNTAAELVRTIPQPITDTVCAPNKEA